MDRTANTPSAAMRLLDVQVCRARSVHRGRCVRIFGKLLRRRERLHCPTQTIGHRKIECTISKLVPQDSNELVAKSYSDEPTSDDLPSNWRVLNFGKFCDIEGGNQPPKSQFISEPKKGYVRLLQIRDLGERPVPTFIPIGSTSRFCKEGEILIGRYGASVGKIFWAQDGAYNVALT